ncbi:MAG TPA: nucleotidyltransferase substrate binding protein [Candidatus Limnocylindrales bacterium]|nr:nucleotidyltransferase substrate binding protein [Candidatus Limnocylindrales bacterium]
MSDALKRKDIRWMQRFDNFKRAFARLAEAAAQAKQRKLSELEEQGLIQAFEFTHELAWNTLKDFLEARGTTVRIYGSRDATREAFAAELINNGEAWMKMIEHRNETSHTYNEKIANAIVEAILTRYVTEFEGFQRSFLELERKEAK